MWQLRAFSYPAAGEVSVKLGNTELFGGNEPNAFKPMTATICVYADGKVIAKQSVVLKFGEYKRVILKSDKIKQGNYSVVTM